MAGEVTALPRYVHRRKRDGVLLFRKRYGASIFERRLQNQVPAGRPVTEELLEEVDALLHGGDDYRLILRAPRAADTGAFVDTMGRCRFAAMEKSAKTRAKKYQFSYALPDGWCLEKFHDQGGKCVVTGITFRQDLNKRSPFMPSLDRIDPKQGYLPGNCRLVAYIVNCALGQFGMEAFREMCAAVTRQHAETTEIVEPVPVWGAGHTKIEPEMPEQ